MNAKIHKNKVRSRSSYTGRVLFSSIASLLAPHAGFAAEAVFSSGAFTSDATSGVSSTKTYTAIANVIGSDVTVNGATFVGSGTDLSGTGWELTNLPNLFGSGGIHQGLGGAAIANLFDGFQYGGDPGMLTLSGLTTGQTYVATLYNQAWTLGDDRTNTFTSSEGASTLYNSDALAASALRYTFVATGATTTLNFGQLRANYSLHVYGLSNEQVFTNSWTAANGSWDTAANWSSGVVPNAAGTNASFGSQPGPTTVTFSFSQPRTVGHMQFLGTGSYTVAGSLLKLQADAGGTSVINTEAGGSHFIDASIQISTNDLAKFGAGTLTLLQNVFGSKGVTVGAGTLRFGSANDYTGATTVDAGATLDLNGTSQTFSALNGAGTVVNDNSGTSLATVESGRFSGSIRNHNSGTGIVALTKNTNGTFTLAGSNTYTGPTTINAGTLKLEGAGGTPLVTDNFLAPNTPNTADLNFNLANRQTGSAALQFWTPNGNTQVGNPTLVQQPAGTYGNYLLLAFGASASLDGLPLDSTNVPGPLKVNFDMFKGTITNGDPTWWTSFAIRATGGNGFPVTGSGEFGLLYRQNTGVQVFNNGAAIDNIATTSGGDSFGIYLADSAGTGSPFAGNGTRVVVTQGGNILGSYALDIGMGTSYINFGSGSPTIGGVDNLAVTPFSVQTTNVLDPTMAVSLTAPGAALQLDGVYQTVSSLSGVAGSAVNLFPFSRLTVNSTTNTTFNGTISGPLATLVKDGPSVLELGAAANTQSNTTISGGTILGHNAASLGAGEVSIASGANYLAWFNTGTPLIRNNFTLNGLGGNPGDGLKSAIYADGGGAGFPEYVFTGNVTLAATSNISGNNLNNQRVVGQITGPGGLTKGSGRADENSALILNNTANDYAGDTVITNGTLKLGASEVIPDGAGKGRVVLSAGATFDLAGNNERINNLSGFGTITSSPAVIIGGPVFFGTNADSGISAAKTYTHALDFGDGSGATVNGVAFEAAANAGANWTLDGATFLISEAVGAPSTPSFPDEPDGTAMNQLLSDFYYNGNPATLTLTGLVPATSYELRLYQRLWGGDRTQLFAFNAGPSNGYLIYNEDASTTPSYLSFHYTADASGTATLSTTQLGAGTYHWYGLTNEEATALPDPVLTVGDATDSTFSGTITGPLEIEKVGTGALTLDGTLDFSTLTVTEGRLNLDAALDNATINADSGTLVVDASLTDTTVNVGATNTTYFTDDQTLTALTIAAGGKVVLTDSPVPTAAAALLAAGQTQAVPEPGSVSLLLFGALGLFGWRRDRSGHCHQ